MLKRVLGLLITLLCVAPAWANPLFSGVQARLSNAPLVHGDFVQKKALKGIKKPLQSSGRFIVDKSRGVL